MSDSQELTDKEKNIEASNKEKLKDALEYHAMGKPGKIEVISTKPCITSKDLSLAYSPGVAAPCMEINKDPELSYKYTSKGNLVGVISNGTAVLGLGNIGALAGKPVMEGKGVLFKRFADIDVFDIEVDDETVDGMVNFCKAIAPTFGGINLEDIKAPECFEIEERLSEMLDIPVFHDDQHGTAIISAAAFINALELVKKDISKVIVVFSGAGAASVACAKLFIDLGVKKENLILTDSKGVIYIGRTKGMNKYKDLFAIKTDKRTIADAMDGADVFVGCSVNGVINKDMVKTMAKDPIIFAMANPYPEIYPEEVAQVREDAIMATGRSDYPNQVNNVLGFPFIFRGALDVKAKRINKEMKLAAVYALANLTKEEIPDEVKKAYSNVDFKFGRDYLIPKPFDKRVLTRVAPAVAKAAMDSGVARINISDMKKYSESLEERLGGPLGFVRSLRNRLDKNEKIKLVFAEGDNARILKAVGQINEEETILPILLGRKEDVHFKMKELGLEDLMDLEIIDPEEHAEFKNMYKEYHNYRARKGVSLNYAAELMSQSNYFGSMLVKKGIADGLITGATKTYKDCIKPLLNIIPTTENKKAFGIIILLFKDKVLFLADCTAQIDPSPEDMADIAFETTKIYKSFMSKDPNIAFLSFSNFGANNHPKTKKVVDAVKLTQELHPQLKVDGEFQADVAVNNDLRKALAGFSKLDGPADILIFPDLNSSNIAYKLLSQLSDAASIGPILAPLEDSANIVQLTSSVREIINMSTLTAVMAHEKKQLK
jgi:malate dehydrogenase (oxaloacetate-decarboxylating)(NADP+)